MQSELVSHIGMSGKLFCRICELFRQEGDVSTGGQQSGTTARAPAPDIAPTTASSLQGANGPAEEESTVMPSAQPPTTGPGPEPDEQRLRDFMTVRR